MQNIRYRQDGLYVQYNILASLFTRFESFGFWFRLQDSASKFSSFETHFVPNLKIIVNIVIYIYIFFRIKKNSYNFKDIGFLIYFWRIVFFFFIISNCFIYLENWGYKQVQNPETISTMENMDKNLSLNLYPISANRCNC